MPRFQKNIEPNSGRVFPEQDFHDPKIVKTMISSAKVIAMLAPHLGLDGELEEVTSHAEALQSVKKIDQKTLPEASTHAEFLYKRFGPSLTLDKGATMNSFLLVNRIGQRVGPGVISDRAAGVAGTKKQQVFAKVLEGNLIAAMPVGIMNSVIAAHTF